MSGIGRWILLCGHAELKNLLWELYRLPGRQSQRMERKCQELYEGWGIQLPDVNCNYLSCAVGVVYGTSQKLAIRKEILQAVSEQYDVSVSAVDSGIRRMIDQLEAKPRPSGCASRTKADLRTRNLPLVN